MYYFIVNPASGSGRGLSVWKNIEAELKRRSVPYRAYLLSGRGEAKKLAQGFASLKKPATVVAVGGDGTINEIINGLRSFEHITFACIPTGSGNDFVRGLGLHKNPEDALRAILNPKEILNINIGRVTAENKAASGSVQNTARNSSKETSPACSFAVSSGVGFDAAVCNTVLKSKLKTLLNRFHSGKLVYLFTALWQLFTMKRQMLHVTYGGVRDASHAENAAGRTPCCPPSAPENTAVPGARSSHTYEKAYFAAAMNLPYEGGGFRFCPDARPDDGCFDFIVASGISRLQALLLLPRALFGRHVGHRGIHIVRCESADVTISAKTCLHTDGEIPGFYTHVSYSVCEEKLPVILR